MLTSSTWISGDTAVLHKNANMNMRMSYIVKLELFSFVPMQVISVRKCPVLNAAWGS